MSGVASPYAAPHTPIASSKRPRQLKPGASRSPSGSMDVSSPNAAVKSPESAVPPTPSKNMFSPGLRETNEAAAAAAAAAAAEAAKPAEEPLDSYEEEEEEDEEVFNPYLFMANLPPHASVVIRDKICLPPIGVNDRRATLALDLDETLVHCTVEPIPKPDLTFPVTFNGAFYQVYVRKRPYLDYFLETVAKNFEVVVFTASQKVYADVLLDLLDPDRKLIEHRLFREACLYVQGNYLKDLHVLGRDAKKALLVDNSPHAYGYDIDNGIPIESWFDDDTDTELLKLIGFLREVVDTDDVRPAVHNHFKTHELIHNARNGIPVPTTAPPF